MILGKSAGTAASIAIDDKVSIKLIEPGQKLTQPLQNPN